MKIYINNKPLSTIRHYITIADLIRLDGIYPDATEFIIKRLDEDRGKFEQIEKGINDIIELRDGDEFNIIPNQRSQYNTGTGNSEHK